MNKGELIAALAAKTEMTKKDSEAALNAVLDNTTLEYLDVLLAEDIHSDAVASSL